MKARRQIIVYIATSADGLHREARWRDGLAKSPPAHKRLRHARLRYHYLTFMGEGIPLVARRHRDVSLHLRWDRKYPDGVV